MFDLELNENGNYIITKEMHKKRKELGIPQKTFYGRVNYSTHYDENTVFNPVRKKKNDFKKYRPIMEKNNISYNCFKARIRLGWTPEQACSVPVKKYKRTIR